MFGLEEHAVEESFKKLPERVIKNRVLTDELRSWQNREELWDILFDDDMPE